jgi:septum site-determining protein MinC
LRFAACSVYNIPTRIKRITFTFYVLRFTFYAYVSEALLQVTDAVIIKGVREGLLLILDDDVPFSQILTELVTRINAQPGFFKGSGVTLNTGRRVLDGPDFDVLYRMLSRNGMRVLALVSLSAQSRMVAENSGVASRPPSFAAGDAGVSLGLKGRGSGLVWTEQDQEEMADTAPGLFLRCSLMPGQSVRYGGDVCVLGDVEAGAEIVAEGDVVVWGKLKGLVHAGIAGDDEAVVCALHLDPTQLAIAGVITRFPSSSDTGSPVAPHPPQIARLEEGKIVVEAWQYED